MVLLKIWAGIGFVFSWAFFVWAIDARAGYENVWPYRIIAPIAALGFALIWWLAGGL